MINTVYVCECGSAHHQFVVCLDEEYDEAYVSIHLNKFGFWKRLVAGIQYILGKESDLGHFEEVILNRDQMNKLQNSLKKRKK